MIIDTCPKESLRPFNQWVVSRFHGYEDSAPERIDVNLYVQSDDLQTNQTVCFIAWSIQSSIGRPARRVLRIGLDENIMQPTLRPIAATHDYHGDIKALEGSPNANTFSKILLGQYNLEERRTFEEIACRLAGFTHRWVFSRDTMVVINYGAWISEVVRECQCTEAGLHVDHNAKNILHKIYR